MTSPNTLHSAIDLLGMMTSFNVLQSFVAMTLLVSLYQNYFSVLIVNNYIMTTLSPNHQSQAILGVRLSIVSYFLPGPKVQHILSFADNEKSN